PNVAPPRSSTWNISSASCGLDNRPFFQEIAVPFWNFVVLMNTRVDFSICRAHKRTVEPGLLLHWNWFAIRVRTSHQRPPIQYRGEFCASGESRRARQDNVHGCLVAIRHLLTRSNQEKSYRQSS